MEPRLYIR